MAINTKNKCIDPASGEEIENPVILFHAPCPDGFCAALAAWIHFDGQGDYVPISHEQQPPDVTGRSVYMLDIAFDMQTMQRVDRQASRLIVLDHHRSAADDLASFKCRCGKVHFDLSKSAARLSWEFFHPDTPVPDIVTHVEDRDLLNWMFTETEPYVAALDAGPFSFHRWRGILGMQPEALAKFMERGRAMRDMSKKMAHDLAAHAMPVTLNGIQGLMANAGMVFHNDVGALLVERGGTFAAVWCVENDAHGRPRVRVGLRSNGDVNVIPIAKAFGGGGHPNSSAFRLPVERLGELLSGKLQPVVSTEEGASR